MEQRCRRLVALLVVLANSALAESQAPSATVTVRASAVSEAEKAAPTSFVNVIDAPQYANEGETVTDALGDSVGVSVRRYGGLGSFSTLSIRGSSSNQVQIYLDGVPLSRAQNETVNLADLPIDCLERLEVYRGAAPVRFGVAGIGGIVNLVTKAPSETPVTSASASYGSFTTRKVVATHSRRVGQVDVLGYVTYLGSAGNFRYKTDNDTPEFNTGDDKEVTRVNNGFDSVDTLLKATAPVSSTVSVDLISETFWKQNGLPGRGANQSTLASASDVRALNYLRLRSADWLLPQLDLDATVYGVYERTTFQDPKAQLGTGAQDRHDQSTAVGGTITPSLYVASQALNGLLDLGYETFNPNNDARHLGTEPDANRLRFTSAGQNQIDLWNERITLLPTLRYEHVHDETQGALQGGGFSLPPLSRDRDLFSPSGGVQVRPLPWLTLRGNIGQYQRAPNLMELFGNTGVVIGNPSLKSESALNRDIGFVVSPPGLPLIDSLRFEYAYFDNHIDDLIVFVQRSAAIFKPENVGSARISGHEISGRLTALRWLSLDANYTYQDAENQSTENNGVYYGNQLPGRPRNEVYTRLAYAPEWGALYYEFNFMSGNFLDKINYDELPSRDIHTFGSEWKVYGPLTVSFQARNVTDNQISDVAGFPLPGRSFFGSVGAQF